VHYGLLILRTPIAAFFAINELAATWPVRFRWGLFNSHAGGANVQIRAIRYVMPLDVLLGSPRIRRTTRLAARSITPLKDRIGSEIPHALSVRPSSRWNRYLPTGSVA